MGGRGCCGLQNCNNVCVGGQGRHRGVRVVPLATKDVLDCVPVATNVGPTGAYPTAGPLGLCSHSRLGCLCVVSQLCGRR
jgi:hypothetical protein